MKKILLLLFVFISLQTKAQSDTILIKMVYKNTCKIIVTQTDNGWEHSVLVDDKKKHRAFGYLVTKNFTYLNEYKNPLSGCYKVISFKQITGLSPEEVKMIIFESRTMMQ